MLTHSLTHAARSRSEREMQRRGIARDRRGATIVLVALLLIPMMICAGIAIDFSRMYLIRAQLQNAADAAAHSGVVSLKNGSWTRAQNDAVIVGNLNRVESAMSSVVVDSVFGGTWDFKTQQFQNTGFKATTSAVRVTAHYPTAYTLLRVIRGATGQTQTATAIAAIGYHSESTCLKPFGVSYRDLLNALPNGATLPLSHDLTQSEVNYLSSMQYPRDSLGLIAGTPTQVTSGNIAEIQTWPNGSNYNNAVSSNGCTSIPIGPGDTIPSSPCAGSGCTKNPLKSYCDNNGGTTQVKGGDFTCNTQPKVELVIYDQVVNMNGGGGGANTGYVVKYVGVFRIDAYHGGGKAGEEVVGTFGTLNDPNAGGFSNKPGLLGSAVALVQ